MPIAKGKKEALVEYLLNIKRQGQRLELSLRFRNKPSEAVQVRKSVDVLSDAVDDLLGALMDAWAGKADALEADFRSINARLQASIRDIRAKIKVAENVVKAIGLIDEAVDKAAALLKA